MSERWQEVRAILERAVDLEGEARRAYLDEACAGDAELRAEVERILAREGSGDPDFLEPPPLEQAPPEQHTLGEFVLLREIGRGGGAVVYLARQPNLGRHVAVKVLTEGPATTPTEIERFHREPRSFGRLRHPGIVQVFSDGQVGNTHWFAMEFVEGHDLARELQLQKAFGVLASDQPFLPRPGEPEHAATAARLCADVADALHHAHQHGLVHRDVKPQNLLLQPDGRVQVADFGLVHDESMGSITRTNVIAGTPYYMSPEQARVRQGKVDHRTDIYSLGVVLYELVTLQRPFEGATNADVITKIRDYHPRSPRAWNPSIPRDLETICLKAMSKDPRERYATAAEMRDDLRRFLAHEAILAKPPSALQRSLRFLKRRRLHVGAAALVAGGLYVGAASASHLAATRTLGRVSVALAAETGAAVEGDVALRRIDPVTGVAGEAVALGRLPIERERVEPGYYRVVVAIKGYGERVFARTIDARQHVEIEGLVAPRQREREGMVLIAGGTLALADEGQPLVAINGRRIDVPSFWLDATEVSNGQYRAFLDATGHRPPDGWDLVPKDKDNLPVTRVGWSDAQAYAEWAGKHLPSFAEWTWAARGAEARIYPSGDEGEPRGNVHQATAVGSHDQLRDVYLTVAAPVGSHPDARTPSGLYNMFGNVGEWTESPPSAPSADGWQPRMMDRIVAGHGWDAATFAGIGHTLRSFEWAGAERESAEYRIGFRCAASAAVD